MGPLGVACEGLYGKWSLLNPMTTTWLLAHGDSGAVTQTAARGPYNSTMLLCRPIYMQNPKANWGRYLKKYVEDFLICYLQGIEDIV